MKWARSRHRVCCPIVCFCWIWTLRQPRIGFNRPLDRMESQGFEYNRKLRDGFLTEAERKKTGRTSSMPTGQSTRFNRISAGLHLSF